MPGTTPTGLPYPLPTEPVAEGAQRIRELAEALDGRPKSASAGAPFAYTASDLNYRYYTPALTVNWNDFAPYAVFANGRFNCPLTGRYLITFTASSLPAGNCGISPVLNNTTRPRTVCSGVVISTDGVKPSLSVSICAALALNDSLQFSSCHSGGAVGGTALGIEAVLLGKPLGTLLAEGEYEEAAALLEEIERWQSSLPEV